MRDTTRIFGVISYAAILLSYTSQLIGASTISQHIVLIDRKTKGQLRLSFGRKTLSRCDFLRHALDSFNGPRHYLNLTDLD